MRVLVFFFAGATLALSAEKNDDEEDKQSRKILGSSVVTSVSVIMDTGNGSKAVYTDAVGNPLGKPISGSELGSPISLLSPDRYEFYTFDDNGELIKRLMSLDEIKGIIASGDSDGLDFDTFTSEGYLPEKRVNDVVNNVQNVLKEEIETHKYTLNPKPLLDTPDVSDSWSMILPAVFGNSGGDIKPEKPIVHVTPDTIMIEPNMVSNYLSPQDRGSSTVKPYTEKLTSFMSGTGFTPSHYHAPTKKPELSSTSSEIWTSQKLVTLTPKITTPTADQMKPVINAEIYSNSKPTTLFVKKPLVELKPTEANKKNVSLSSKIPTNKRPLAPTVPETTFITNTQPTSSQPFVIIASTSSVWPGSTAHITKPSSVSVSPSFAYTPSASNLEEFTKYPATLEWRTESVTEKAPPLQISTWRPHLTTSQTNDLPILSELVNSINKSNVSEILTTVPNERFTETEKFTQTQEYKQQTTEKLEQDDLSTLGSEYELPTSHTTINYIPVEQTMSTIDKISASTLLDRLLLTTNVYDINTELTEKITNQIRDEDERFETSIKQDSRTTPSRTEMPSTTEKYMINDQTTTDRTLMDSIEQLFSQAVNDVGEALANGNDTASIQIIHNGTDLPDVEERTSTITTDRNGQDATTPDRSVLLSDSVDSLLLQIAHQNAAILPSFSNVVTERFYSTPGKVTRKSDDTENLTTEKMIPDDVSTVAESKTTDSAEKQTEQSTSVRTDTIFADQSVVKNDDPPRLINITILTADNTKRNKEPTKVDISLEQLYYGVTRNNVTNPLNVSESTEIYIETAPGDSTISNSDKNSSLNGISAETIKNESSTEVNRDVELIENIPQTLEPDLDTLTSFVPTSEESTTFLNTNEKSPSTVVIIRRTVIPHTTEITSLTPGQKNEAATLPIAASTTETSTLQSFEPESLLTTQETSSLSGLFSEPTIQIIINETELNGVATNKVVVEAASNSYDEVSKTATKAPVLSTTHRETISYVLGDSNKPTEDIETSKTATEIESLESTTVELATGSVNNDTVDGNSSIIKKNKTNEITVETPGSSWTLVSTVAPHANFTQTLNVPPSLGSYPQIIDPPTPIDLKPKPVEGFGLEETTSRLDPDIYQFTQLCNELAFGFWKTVTTGISSARSVFVSPFGSTSLLAMVFLGARGSTSGEMNEILKLDDMVTFNPHLIFKDVSESIRNEEQRDSGVAASAIIREIFSDRSKGNLLPFYKARAKAFYDGYIEEVSFREIKDIIRARTNLQVKKNTGGKIAEFLKDNSIDAKSPLAAISANIFQTDCSQASIEGRDGELHFVVLPSMRQRRLVPVPAVVYKSGCLAGYEPSLDATAVALGGKDKVISTILVLPGQQGMPAPGDGLARLEKRLVESSFKKGAWSRLMRSLIPRQNLEVQIPRFSHKSIINSSLALKKMGVHDLFDVEKADLRGLNGVANELFLSEILQVNSFATCGENFTGTSHHSEIYPTNSATYRNARYLDLYRADNLYHRTELFEEPRDYQRAFHDPLHDPRYLALPLPLRPRQARLPETPRLKFDRPFLYFIRHNPTGLILHMGRFNPRLLP